MEIYQPVLRDLHRLEQVLQTQAFPTRVRYDYTKPIDSRSSSTSTADVSWWNEHKDQGAHLRIAPSIAARLDGIVEKGRSYRAAYVDFGQTLKNRINQDVDLHRDTLTVRFKEVYRVQPEEWNALIDQFLTGDVAGASEYLTTYFEEKDIVEQILADVQTFESLKVARSLAGEFKIQVTKTIHVLEGQISLILIKHEKRTEEV